MNALTLPRDLSTPAAGPILCAGAPVIETGESGMKGARGTIVCRAPRDGDSGLRVWWATVCEGMVTSVTHGTALDLSASLGMDIAARWLAAHYGLTVGATAPGWGQWECAGRGVWSLWPVTGPSWCFADDVSSQNPNGLNRGRESAVCGISALTDPIAAMRLTCLHAAGRDE